MGLSTRPTVIEQELNVVSPTQQGALGAEANTLDGRVYRYGLVGAATLALGKLTTAPLGVANHQNLVVPAASNIAVGSQQVTVTLGGTAATANQYAGGYLQVYDGTGAGQNLLIRNHPAQASTTGNLTLNLVDPLSTAIVAGTSKVSLAVHPMTNLIISDASGTATTDVFGGVPDVSVTAANYGWFQVRGVTNVLIDGTPAVGSGVIQGTVAGSVAVEAATTVTSRIGVVYSVAGVTTKYGFVNLAIA